MTSRGEGEELHTDLRAWAKGMYTTEAAVELLIRGFNGRFAGPGNPWIIDNENGGQWGRLRDAARADRPTVQR